MADFPDGAADSRFVKLPRTGLEIEIPANPDDDLVDVIGMIEGDPRAGRLIAQANAKGSVGRKATMPTPSDEEFESTINRSPLGRQMIRPAGAPYTPGEIASLEAMMGFDRDGPGESSGVLSKPLTRIPGLLATQDQAVADTSRAYPGGGRPWNNAADAYRHADLAVRLVRAGDPQQAQRIMDGHERSNPNPLPERTMDLLNNHNARMLAQIFPNLPPAELARLAVNSGYLILKPAEIAP